VGGALIVLALATLGGVTWYYSDEIIAPKRRVPLETDITVAAVDDTSVTLAGSRLARTGTIWFLEWKHGLGVTWNTLERDSARIRRRFHAMVGEAEISAGMHVALGAYPYEWDPVWAYGIQHEEVYISTANGEAPAWFIPGARDTWMVFVHGKAAGRGQAMRMLPSLRALELPILIITYRNGPGGPRSSDRVYHLGASEWQDLEAAVRYAQRHGARRVVLYGYSMGGSVVANFLAHSKLAGAVSGVVLDSPVLDWDAVVQVAARRRRVPAFVTTLAEQLVAWRTGFRWSGPEGKVSPDVFRVPVLLFHGSADGTVPIAGSEALAKALGNRVTFLPTEGAGHIQSWNFNPEGYEFVLCNWLNFTGAREVP
jgi:pimeloyl-ACP methyl ester carboxylesterase